jgi:hypothetical protein
METIGARVINELYVNHLFSVALSLHGGTESFTYPYGTPNHIMNSNIPKIPMKYTVEKGKAVDPTPLPNTLNQAELFRSGTYDMIMGKSSEPPDANALGGI